MTRFVPVTVLVLLEMLLMTGGAAHAQGTGSGSLPNGATIVFEHLKIFDPSHKPDPFSEPDANSTVLRHYFNLAHCNCAKANVGKPNTMGTLNYLVHETSPTQVPGIPADFFAGTSCDDPAHRPSGAAPTCVKLDNSVNDIDAQLNATGGSPQNFNLYQIVNANLPPTTTPPDMGCQQLDNASNSIFVLIDTNKGTNYNVSFSQVAGALGSTGTTSGIDTRPPPQPLNLTAHSNESEIDVTWSASSSGTSDIAYYQALCAMADGVTPVFPSRTHDPQYVTTQATCPPIAAPSYEHPMEAPLPNGEAQVSLVTGSAFAALDANYICGEVSTGTANSLQIKHLQNEVPYQVILVAVDLHGNFIATHFDHTITPHLVTDFWEDLHQNGSQAEGGLCLLAETYGDDSTLTHTLRAFRDDTLGASRAGRWLGRAYYATLARLGGYVHGSIALRALSAIVLAPLVAFALLWHWLGLPGVLGLLATAWWLRRRARVMASRVPSWWSQRWFGAAVTVALIALGAGPAHAGNGGYQPYWENTDPTRESEREQVPPGDPSLVSWRAGVRIGPYTPDIDDQLNMHPGPFEQMFGTSQHLLTMLDVDRILWTGFGQIGVGGSIGYWQKTASAFATVNGQTSTMLSSAHNAFRLVPLALTATYRFTWLDDNYGIPLVPYARGGLSYYVWWISINDHFARLCDGAGENCTNKALGASLGVQGSIGLAIRAERIDASAAQSMRQSGLQHAGIYGELSLAKVDGFGSSKKLSVGDRTWFAGVDFEF